MKPAILSKEDKRELAEFLARKGWLPKTQGEVVVTITPERTVSSIKHTAISQIYR